MTVMMRATFRVTTPLFSGGADPKVAELRAPSFKGVLRFWWRACAWSRFNGDLATICTEEASVFGSPEQGQSRVAVRLSPTDRVSRHAPGEVLPGTGEGTRYLGYGLMHTAGSVKRGIRAAELIRGCLGPTEVAVELRARGLTDAQSELLVEAVRALGTLGGMGARSRRGFGSLSLMSLADGDGEPVRLTSREALLRQVCDLARTGPNRVPEYTALSPRSRFLIGRDGAADAMKALNRLGEEYRAFRRSERGDHQPSMLEGDAAIVLKDRPTGAYPKRAGFGLPINYGQDKPVVTPASHDRRASPLFFHIHSCDDQTVAVVSFLPACFLPELRISIGAGAAVRGLRTVALPDPDTLYLPVDEFLTYLSRSDGMFREVGEGP